MKYTIHINSYNKVKIMLSDFYLVPSYNAFPDSKANPKWYSVFATWLCFQVELKLPNIKSIK